jgi:hypothetical protein
MHAFVVSDIYARLHIKVSQHMLIAVFVTDVPL